MRPFNAEGQLKSKEAQGQTSRKADLCGGGVGTYDRRRFLVATGAFLVASDACFSQQRQVLQRIGFLSLGSPAASSHLIRAFGDALRERGHVEGRDVEIEVRFAEGR